MARGLACATIALVAWGMTAGRPVGLGAAQPAARAPIDRHALVTRHNVELRRFDPESPLSVGNGEFAFTVDVTGLQTFPEAFENTTPLGTLSQWGWHSAPNPQGWKIDTFPYTKYDTYGRAVGYADIPGNQRTPEIEWLRANPHRLHLGRIGFRLTKTDGTRGRPEHLSEIAQALDLWNGVITSRFTFDGEPVVVRTLSHPTLDAVAVHVTSPLARAGRLAIEFQFPYGTGQTVTADWSRPEAHQTTWTLTRPGAGRFARRLDADAYAVDTSWAPASASMTDAGRHLFVLSPPAGSDALAFAASFAPRASAFAGPLPSFDEAQVAASAHWQRFWTSGGAIDLSGSRDPRWRELERRVVLSRYLTAIQCAGSVPPQETGLTYNSWEGKFHLEMHWWHAVHFAAWDRIDLLEKSLGYYERILPRARATAARQGYTGARWPKMTDPHGEESPSAVGPFLMWQQPHPIYYAELVYRAHQDRDTLDRFATVVSETAEFMASFAVWEASRKKYVLGPPLQCAQERFSEGLHVRVHVRDLRTGVGDSTPRRHGRCGVGSPATSAGTACCRDSTGPARWAGSTSSRTPGRTPTTTRGGRPTIPPCSHRSACCQVTVWTAGRCGDAAVGVGELDVARHVGMGLPDGGDVRGPDGRTRMAVGALLLDTPKNRYGVNGHNYQRPGLTIYLPGNGGLLTAVAMMAAGWDGAPAVDAPGFPNDGQWTVRWEGLRRFP